MHYFPAICPPVLPLPPIRPNPHSTPAVAPHNWNQGKAIEGDTLFDHQWLFAGFLPICIVTGRAISGALCAIGRSPGNSTGNSSSGPIRLCRFRLVRDCKSHVYLSFSLASPAFSPFFSSCTWLIPPADSIWILICDKSIIWSQLFSKAVYVQSINYIHFWNENILIYLILRIFFTLHLSLSSSEMRFLIGKFLNETLWMHSMDLWINLLTHMQDFMFIHCRPPALSGLEKKIISLEIYNSKDKMITTPATKCKSKIAVVTFLSST